MLTMIGIILPPLVLISFWLPFLSFLIYVYRWMDIDAHRVIIVILMMITMQLSLCPSGGLSLLPSIHHYISSPDRITLHTTFIPGLIIPLERSCSPPSYVYLYRCIYREPRSRLVFPRQREGEGEQVYPSVSIYLSLADYSRSRHNPQGRNRNLQDTAS